MSASVDNLPEEVQTLLNSYGKELKPLSPDEAIESYLQYRHDLRPQTVSEYARKLDHFRTFCSIQGIDNVNDLDGRLINDFRHYRRTETVDRDEPLSPKTMRDDMYLFRDFLTHLAHIEAVSSDLPDRVEVPELDKNDGVRDIDIDPDRVDRILDYLERYEYATRPHVVWLFHTHTGRRPGGLYALDLEDVHVDTDDPHLEFHHRPGETELKKDEDGEGEVHLSYDVAEVFRDYIENNRVDVTTENDRQPFLTSTEGRLTKSTMRKYIYKYSRPCLITGDCPHSRDTNTCEAAQQPGSVSKCPSSKPPYALRHGYITSKRAEGVPLEIISGRCDVSAEVIEKHYDERDESEKRALRQKIFDEVRDQQDGGGFR